MSWKNWNKSGNKSWGKGSSFNSGYNSGNGGGKGGGKDPLSHAVETLQRSYQNTQVLNAVGPLLQQQQMISNQVGAPQFPGAFGSPPCICNSPPGGLIGMQVHQQQQQLQQLHQQQQMLQPQLTNGVNTNLQPPPAVEKQENSILADLGRLAKQIGLKKDDEEAEDDDESTPMTPRRAPNSSSSTSPTDSAEKERTVTTNAISSLELALEQQRARNAMMRKRQRAAANERTRQAESLRDQIRQAQLEEAEMLESIDVIAESAGIVASEGQARIEAIRRRRLTAAQQEIETLSSQDANALRDLFGDHDGAGSSTDLPRHARQAAAPSPPQQSRISEWLHRRPPAPASQPPPLPPASLVGPIATPTTVVAGGGGGGSAASAGGGSAGSSNAVGGR